MKLLVAASAVDLDFRYGCTPAWWQLWKGLYEEGVDLVVTPYRGRAVESPWWRTAPNPTFVEGESFARARDVVARLKGDSYLRRAEDNPEDGLGERMTREVIWRWVTPRWRRHLDALVETSAPMPSSSSRCRWPTCAASRRTCASASACRSSSTTATCR